MHSPANIALLPSPTLAQGAFGGLTIPTPPPLPRAPIWETYIFEQPWPLAVVLILVGIAVLLKGRGRPRAIVPALSLLAAIGVVAAGMLVTTAREKIMASTRALVAAVVHADSTTLDAELDESAKLFSFQHNDGVDKWALLDEVARRFSPGAELAIKDWSIEGLEASRDGERVGRSLVKVRAVSAAAGVPVFSWWLLDYRMDTSGRWRVIRMEPQSISFVNDARAKH